MARGDTIRSVKIWFNLGFPLNVDLSEADTAIVAANAKALRGYCSCFIPLAIIACAAFSTQTSNYMELLIPFGMGIIVFFLLAFACRGMRPTSKGGIEYARALCIVFSGTLLGLAFYHDIIFQPDVINLASCMIFCVACSLFDEKPLYFVSLSVIAYCVGCVLMFIFPGKMFAMNAISMALAAVLGIVTAWIKSRNAYNAVIEARKELDLSAQMARSQVMVSQMKPHFVSNVLSTIYVLCDQDPEKAKYTIEKFNTYMRNNIDALSSNNADTFDKELDHVMNYVDLEKVRFGDKLNVEYHIGPTDFATLPLSVQPLVENAVKHGVGNKRGGGTVIISTGEDAENYYITVQDDGRGIEALCVEQVPDPQDDRTHVGLHSTKSRVRAILKGELMFLSDPKAGTIVTIVTPKKESAKALKEEDQSCKS